MCLSSHEKKRMTSFQPSSVVGPWRPRHNSDHSHHPSLKRERKKVLRRERKNLLKERKEKQGKIGYSTVFWILSFLFTFFGVFLSSGQVSLDTLNPRVILHRMEPGDTRCAQDLLIRFSVVWADGSLHYRLLKKRGKKGNFFLFHVGGFVHTVSLFHTRVRIDRHHDTTHCGG